MFKSSASARRQYDSHGASKYAEGDIFCRFCGNELRELDTSTEFDPQTGEMIQYFVKACVKPVVKRFLWWSWRGDEGCGAFYDHYD